MTAICDELFQNGFAMLRLPPADGGLLSRTLAQAYDYFQLDAGTKQRDFYPGRHIGFRQSGIEYSATPERPDLNDSLNLSAGWRQAVPETSPAMGFYLAADRMLEALDQVAQTVLAGIARRYPGEHHVPETRRHSWLQVNYYRPLPNMRPILQDKHEDAHLLTLWHSRKPGLEVFPQHREDPLPVTADEDSLLVMPGSLLTMLTGGDVLPLYHRVVQSPAAEWRLALMYFVNPTVDRPLYAYKLRPGEAPQDIAAVGARNPELFGLPQLRQSNGH